MKLSVTGKQLDISNTNRAAIDRKIARLERLLNNNAVSAQCVVTRQRQRFVCDLTVHVRGDHILHAVAGHDSIPAAVGLAVDKVEQQAHRVVDRWKDKRRVRRPVPVLADFGRRESAAPKLVRSRRYPLKPMTVDDAVLALEGGKESFLVFRRSETETVAVVYRRPDGRFGLIEPEV